ncbi:MAG: STAS domain-containing protein [Actinobacteria bacterium]|nr:STAS domain-containing protein [Actinomycetota bacterium]
MARISAGRVRVVGAPDVVRALLEVTQVSRLVDLVGEPAASQAGNPWLSPGEAGSISTTEELDATVIHLRGEIDASLRAQAGAVIAQVLDRRLPVILDTGEVTFIDSTGMAFLIQCCTISHQEGLRVTLPDPPAAVTSVVDALAINDLFDLSAERPVDSTD